MERKIVIAKGAPAAVGPYSHAVEAGDMVFLSGQIPIDPATGLLIASSPAEAARQSLKNVAAVLDACGLGFQNVMKSTVFLTDMAHFAEVNAVYAEFFPSNPPARSCVAVAGLPKGALVEIECVAVRP